MKHPQVHPAVDGDADADANDAPTVSPARFDLARRRLRAQHLIGAPHDRPEAVVRWLGAVQAQDYLGAKWAVAQRTRGCTDADVEAAFARGAILRTHVLRPTWHFVVPADIRWLLRLTAPRVHALSASRYRELGLDDATFARSNAALARALQGGHHLTRAELAAVLRSAGLDPGGLRLLFFTFRAELDAVVCSGPRRGKQFTYAAFDERVPATKPLRRDEALTELTRRYFQGHGPARPQDFAWWSGLKVSDAVAGIAMVGSELDQARVGDQRYWFSPAAARPRLSKTEIPLHLLPNFDEYVVAFRDHAPIFDARLAGDLGVRDGVLANHLVVSNGRIVGGWRRTLRRDEVIVEARLAAPLDAAARLALDQAGRRYGRFLGLPVRLLTKAARPRVTPR